MRNRNLFLALGILILISLSFVFTVREVFALEFRPNVEIPGMQQFFEGLYQKKSIEVDGRTEEYYVYSIDGSGLPRYIGALYNYASIIAGVIAMFMLVFAAYQWLLAGGNAERISRAKDTVSGTLLGVALLFGGYLLLSQISDNLVNLKSISVQNIPGIPETNSICATVTPAGLGCGMPFNTTTEGYGSIWCIGQSCSTGSCVEIDSQSGDGVCPNSSFSGDVACECQITDCAAMNLTRCEGYQNDAFCVSNKCFKQDPEQWNFECGIDADNAGQECEPLKDVRCYTADDCNWDGSNKWYCFKGDPVDEKGYCRCNPNVGDCPSNAVEN